MSDQQPKIEPTGLAAALQTAQDRLSAELIKAHDITKVPGKLVALGWIVTIVQLSKLVALGNSAVTELQVGHASEPIVSKWIDAKGVPYTQIINGDKVLLIGGDGQTYDPTLPVKSADAPSIDGAIELVAMPAGIPRAIARKGIEEIVIPAGATGLGIQVFGGSVSAFGASLQPGSTPNFNWASGLTEVAIIGEDADADYLVWYLEPVAAVAKQSPSEQGEPIPLVPVDLPTDEQPLTGELVPPVGAIDPDPLQMMAVPPAA